TTREIVGGLSFVLLASLVREMGPLRLIEFSIKDRLDCLVKPIVEGSPIIVYFFLL
ncbi:unnamed protein product, partial [marine sediment metagenome]